ncbi:MAG: hypothetical protein ACLTDO_06265 [Bifidobacterium pseudocatenulatum]
MRDCIERFLKGKRSRRDVNEFLSRQSDLDSLSRRIADEIGRGEYRFAPIRYFRRVEPISGKIRIIGRESIRHQIYDYVCGTALMPLFRAKVGRWQTASIPGRGIADARRAIKRWVREPSSKVFVKLDVRKCYPSISREVLKRLLSRDVGDRRLLDLTFHLIDQYAGDDGLNIGSYRPVARELLSELRLPLLRTASFQGAREPQDRRNHHQTARHAPAVLHGRHSPGRQIEA